MSDIQQKIDDATSRIVAAMKECEDLEKSANAHEEQARSDRRRRTELKKEIEELNTVLRHSHTQKLVISAEEAAQQSRVAAEQLRADAEALHAQARETLTSLEAQKAELAKLIEERKESS